MTGPITSLLEAIRGRLEERAKPSKSFKSAAKEVHKDDSDVTYRAVGAKRWDALVKSPKSKRVDADEGGNWALMHGGRLYLWSADDDQAYEVIEESESFSSGTLAILEAVRERLVEADGVHKIKGYTIRIIRPGGDDWAAFIDPPKGGKRITTDRFNTVKGMFKEIEKVIGGWPKTKSAETLKKSLS